MHDAGKNALLIFAIAYAISSNLVAYAISLSLIANLLYFSIKDFPTILEGAKETQFVGFTSISADLCFSPVKNATADGVTLQDKGTHPGVAATGEVRPFQQC